MSEQKKSVFQVHEETKKHDPVHPSHYQGKIETFDYLRDKMGAEQFEGFLAGNVLKYLSRYPQKNGVEDLKKAKVYLIELIDHLEEDDEDVDRSQKL